MFDIQNEYQGLDSSELAAIADPQQGLAVCCQFSDDLQWYRAEITGKAPDSVDSVRKSLRFWVSAGNSCILVDVRYGDHPHMATMN